jgi:cytochrome c556
MPLRTGIIVSAAVAALASVLLTVRADDDTIRVPKDIQDAVNKMADDIAKDNNVEKDAVAFFKDHKGDLKKTMWLFKPRDKDGTGGLGVGAKPGAYRPDGIEAFLHNQNSRWPSMALNLKTAADDLNRLADVTLALAEILPQYTPEKKNRTNPKIWNDASGDMKQAALALKKNIKAADNARVKQSFLALAESCNKCHTNFRDKDEEKITFIVPKEIRQDVSALADAVGKGEKTDKAADAFFKDHPGDFGKAKLLLKERRQDGMGGFGVGPNAGSYTPDEISGYIQSQAAPVGRRYQPLTEAQLQEAASDFNRLADITIAMAELTPRYQPKHIVIGGPEIATPERWTKEADAMKQGAVDLKAAVKANKPDDVKKAFTKMSSSCVSCHTLFTSRSK